MRKLVLLMCSCVVPLAGAVAFAQSPSELDGLRADVTRAIALAERSPASALDRSLRALGDHPLRPWLEYARLRNALDASANASIEAYLTRWGDIVPARMLRDAWLRQLVERRDWDRFLSWYVDSNDSTLRCGHLRARQDLTGIDAAWLEDARQLWLSPRSLPDVCDRAFEALSERGLIDSHLRWERFDRAAEAGEIGLARFVARGLPGEQARLATDYLDFIETPHDRARAWPATERSRKIATLGLVRLARNDPDEAERRLGELLDPLRKSREDAGPVKAQVALWTVASYREGARERLEAVPSSAYDDRLYEWRVREALARGDDATAIRAIEAMPPEQRQDSRWLYFEARLRERNDQGSEAQRLYAESARHATFHGFLAADRIGAPYALCPLEVKRDLALRRGVAANPALVRAFELFRVDRPGWAAREWNDALAGMSDAERVEAVRLARAIGWHDRVFSLAQENPEELRYYRLRFPLSYRDTVSEQASVNDVDPALVAAVTRAESAWMPTARSPADARGLMQILPATAAGVARRIGITFDGPEALFRPATNLRLGTAYMREMLDRHDGRPYFAIAAYNAGPSPVARWRGERAELDPDFWIETINYRETREYVARVMAFSVIYDWRLGQDAVPVTSRLLGHRIENSERRPFQCPGSSTASAP